MEVKVLNEDKDSLEIELEGESHTLTNLIRKELWKVKDTELASYNLKHPLVSHPVLKLKSKKPRKAIQETVENIKKQTKELKEKFRKL